VAEEEDKDGKTEEPTEQRIKTAVEKGDVPVSRELGVFMPLAAALAGLIYTAQGPATALVKFLAICLDQSGEITLEGDASGLVLTIIWQSALVVLPIVLILMLFGLAGTIAQNQPKFVAERVQPQLARISVAKGFKRIFGAAGLVEFAKSLAKFILLAAVGYNFIQRETTHILVAVRSDPEQLPATLYALSLKLMITIVVTCSVLAAADLAWARFSWRRKLRMSRQEVKDEHKQMEGNPIVKGRLRALARDRARRRMLTRVPSATVVIANPTHFAVALRYVRSEGGAPVVVAKGQDLIALKIREVAEAHGVPIIEDKPLARSLYNSVQVDGMIPPEFYRAVAKVILFIGSRRK
jgi:flagellar biosynthesis protein FlhB